MSIPIDKLYHYIESVAREIRGDDIIIYRFYPHGSKKIEDLTLLRDDSIVNTMTMPQIYCNDQEPLAYEYYKNEGNTKLSEIKKFLRSYDVKLSDLNFAKVQNVYDARLLLHSEQRSSDLISYENNRYIGVYYWSHGLIALDWYRFAQYEHPIKSIDSTFLIYNRAWGGTREYRLKFIDLLIEYNLTQFCKSTVNPIEPELNCHYTEYQFTNSVWQPTSQLENYFNPTDAGGTASADYDIEDYNSTEFEVVLETLFDDSRLHLTEKILRPIALGQPFLLAATHGSLEYLRSYGFRTFASVIDESYDTIEDPRLRLEAIVKAMKEITMWTKSEKAEKMKLVNQIAMYNRRHFFSGKFFNQVVDELTANLKTGLDQLENTNKSEYFINFRKRIGSLQHVAKTLINQQERKDLVKILARAREYYNKR